MANRFVNESYTPGKRYPLMGILSAELPLDERGRNSVLRNLRGPESPKFGEYRVVEYLGRIPKQEIKLEEEPLLFFVFNVLVVMKGK